MQLALFHRHYKVSYLVRGFTSFVFYGICFLCILVLPFVISFLTGSFWLKNNYLFDTPEVEFTDRCALRVTTVLGKEYMWTCSENFNEAYLYGSPMSLIPYLSINQDERDERGRLSEITFILSIPINNLSDILRDGPDAAAEAAPPADRVLDAVRHVEFLPEFTYRIRHRLVRLDMTAAPLLRFARAPPPSAISPPGPLCGLTEADLLLRASLPVRPAADGGDFNREGGPFPDLARGAAALHDLSGVEASRGPSVEARPTTTAAGGLGLLADGGGVRGAWQDPQLLGAFTWRIRLRVRAARVFYRPSFLESLKWAWMQYFAFAYVVRWVVWQVRGLAVLHGVVDTRAVFRRRIN